MPAAIGIGNLENSRLLQLWCYAIEPSCAGSAIGYELSARAETRLVTCQEGDHARNPLGHSNPGQGGVGIE